MAAKKTETAEKQLEKFVFPALGLVIEAESLEQAVEKANAAAKA